MKIGLQAWGSEGDMSPDTRLGREIPTRSLAADLTGVHHRRNGCDLESAPSNRLRTFAKIT